MIERSVGVPFYRMGEGAGHGRGRNGDGKHGRRPWKVAGVGASVPGDWGAIQGGIKGERERRERGLIPPNQFWNSRFESRGFWGGLALGFRGEREQAVREEEDDRTCCARAGSGSAWARWLGGVAWAWREGGRGGAAQKEEERREWAGRGRGDPREREGGERVFGRGPRGRGEKPWARLGPKRMRGLFLGFSF
jgi:hypothetical protein